MDIETFITIISAILGSSLLTAWMTNRTQKPKIEAETKNISVDSEVRLSEATLKFAKVIEEHAKTEVIKLNKKMETMQDKIDVLHTEKDDCRNENRDLKLKIIRLEKRVLVCETHHQ